MSPKPGTCPECSGIQKAIELLTKTLDQSQAHQSGINTRIFERLDSQVQDVNNFKLQAVRELNEVAKKVGKYAFFAAISGGFVFALVEFLIPVLAKIFQGG
jgi:hypothetical protein